jgi:hypothetical protein
VDYEWVGSSDGNQQGRQQAGTGKEWFYLTGNGQVKQVNPSALVPTLIPVVDRATGEVDESKAVLNLW